MLASDADFQKDVVVDALTASPGLPLRMLDQGRDITIDIFFAGLCVSSRLLHNLPCSSRSPDPISLSQPECGSRKAARPAEVCRRDSD